MSNPNPLEALIQKWREKTKALRSGPSHGATRDHEDALAADEIKVCADELEAALASLRPSPEVETCGYSICADRLTDASVECGLPEGHAGDHDFSAASPEVETLIAEELLAIAAFIRTPGNIDHNDARDEIARVLENRARSLASLRGAAEKPTHGYGCPHDGDYLTEPRPANCRCDANGDTPEILEQAGRGAAEPDAPALRDAAEAVVKAWRLPEVCPHNVNDPVICDGCRYQMEKDTSAAVHQLQLALSALASSPSQENK